MAFALYIASVVGAAAVLLMLPRRGFSFGVFGAVLGAAALGGLLLVLARYLPEGEAALGIARPAMIYFYLFSFIAIGSACRVITHTRPVYAALWFVMVVLASSALVLLLGAEFMAFAMIIIYAGAILVTYVFVIMLASEVTDPSPGGVGAQVAGPDDAGADGDADSGDAVLPAYERVAREPLMAVAAGFLLLALISGVLFEPMTPNPQAVAASDREVIQTTLTRRGADRLAQLYGDAADASTPTDGEAVSPRSTPSEVDRLSNVERVGLDLFQSHPLGVELAGIILLISLVGAVVIARKQVSVDEAEDA